MTFKIKSLTEYPHPSPPPPTPSFCLKSCGPLEEDSAPHIQSATTPQNNAYSNSELLASVAEHVSELEALILQGDLEALLSIHTDHQESDTSKRRQFGCHLCEVEPSRGQKESVVWQSSISRGRSQTNALVNKQVLQEALTLMRPDGAARSLNADVDEAVVELLRRSCGRGPSSRANQTLALDKTIV